MTLGEHFADAGTVVVRRSRSKTLILALGCFGSLVFWLADYAGYISMAAPNSLEIRLFKIVGLPIFVLFSIVWFKNLSEPREALEISRLGVVDRRLTPQLVPWSAVIGIDIISVHFTRGLSLFVSRELADSIDSAWYRRLANAVRSSLGFRAAILVSTNGLERSHKDVVRLVRTTWAAAQDTPAMVSNENRHAPSL